MTLGPGRLARLFLPFACGYFLSYLYRTVNAVIAPDLVRDLGLSPDRLGLLTSAYFLAFALAQLPLGVLLDRFGPRRVEGALLVIAAVGAALFAGADNLPQLLAGRALIGIGVSACLMAAFKAFTLWFPPERLPLANGVQMLSGGLGALAATLPVEAALRITDWRGLFAGLAGLTLLAALLLVLLVPEPPAGSSSGESLRRQCSGILDVARDRLFLRLAPWTVCSQATYLALVGLWAGPWLRDVAGFDRDAVAATLAGVAMAMTAGYLGFALLADRLARQGIAPLTVATGGMGLFLVVQLALLPDPAPAPRLSWLLFGFCGTAGILPYALLSQRVAKQRSGRAVTLLNLLVFLGAFAAQWAVGAIIGLWPSADAGRYAIPGYRAGFALLIVLQALGMAWFVVCRGKDSPQQNRGAPED